MYNASPGVLRAICAVQWRHPPARKRVAQVPETYRNVPWGGRHWRESISNEDIR